MKKRVLAMVMALCLVMSFAVSMAFASGDKSGSCGENVTWTLDASGKLTVRGSGAMADYKDGDPRAPWYSYKDQIKSASVESGVTKIGNCAFKDCGNMTSVSISDTVTEIGEFAFRACGKLEKVTIPKSVKTIKSGAFWHCAKLSAVSVAAENQNYSSVDGVLYNKAQTQLLRYPQAKTQTAFNIPSTVTKIGDYAFDCVSVLTSLFIPDTVTSIGFLSLSGVGASTITLPKFLTSIGSCAFFNSPKLKTVTIPETVVSIGGQAFDSCSGLQNVYYAGTEEQWKAIEDKGKDAIASKVQFNRPTYTLSVVNSAQKTVYSLERLDGTTLTWPADAPPSGKAFKEWRGLSAVTLVEGSATSKTIKFTMPAKNVTLFMTYAPAPTGKA